MTSILEKSIKEKQARDVQALAKVKGWDSRLEALKNRKENPLSESVFCDRYGIHKSRFNSLKNGKTTSLPSFKIINQIENALKSEGV